MQDEGSSNSYGVAAGELRSFIERFERLEMEKNPGRIGEARSPRGRAYPISGLGLSPRREIRIKKAGVVIEVLPAKPKVSYLGGAHTEIFTADGLAQLHELTGGVLRSIDILALAALRLASTEDKVLVDRDLVRRALHHTPLV